eukprot:jgi/Chlat1/7781/Chrsp66S07239
MAARLYVSSAAALLVLLLCCQRTLAITWKPCDDEADPVAEIKQIVMTPDPALRGQDVGFDLNLVAGEDVTGGSVTVSVAYRGVPVHYENDDLCDKTACPINKGPFRLNNVQQLPRITPPGPYTLKLSAKGPDGRSLFCANINFNVVSPPSSGGMLGGLSALWK